MRYVELKPIDRQEAERALAGGHDESICDALLRLALHDSDWAWVEERALSFAVEPNSEAVRVAAVQALAHLSRIHRQLHLGKVLPVLESVKATPPLAGRVEDALDDIALFVDGK